MPKEHIEYMRRCLELAEKGRYLVAPNPMVGAVLTRGDRIISEGYHAYYGGPHAERVCLQDLDRGQIDESDVLYVNLEPCGHFGKTPPCADLIIEKGIKKVVLSCSDANEKVAGKGYEKLRSANIQITEGILRKEARYLNRRFFTFHEKHRPYVILKWAETSDGFIANARYQSKWISSVDSRELVHSWRAEEQAILVGTNTVRHDNPFLTARPAGLEKNQYKQPLRVFLDRELSIQKSVNLYDNKSKTLVVNGIKDQVDGQIEYVCIDFAGDLPEQILQTLFERNISSLIVEGGSILLKSFISQNLFDEARVFKSIHNFESGVAAPRLPQLRYRESEIAGDMLRIYNNHDYDN